ncbi:MAG TPA: arylesterase [Sphingopyxis sp.]|nr:arylesterase [Sphingopyxis sp.]
MKIAGWRNLCVYGLAIGLCQPLAGCSDDAAQPANITEVAAGSEPSHAAISADAPLVIAFGDSLYAGYQLGPKEGLAPQLQEVLGKNGVEVQVHNAGVSGDTTAAGLQRLRFVLDHADRKPALLMLGLGGNDMLRGIGPAQTRANLETILDELARRDIPVLMTGMMAPPNLGAAYRAEFDAIFPELAKRKGVTLYPFILDQVVTDPQLMLADHIHPNAQGVTVMAEALAPLVTQALPQTADSASQRRAGPP